jgi:hypothetical protein
MKTFCCIIPARLGVLALAPLTLAASTVCAFFSLYALIQFFHDLQIGQRVFLGLLGSSMAVLALSSVVGFFGAIFASFKPVVFYETVLSHIWLSVVLTGIINFIFIMKDKEYFLANCKESYKNQHAGDATKWCNDVSHESECIET